MKKYSTYTKIGLALVTAFIMVACNGNSNTQQKDIKGIYYGDFAITTSLYESTSNWDEITQKIFGDKYRVADWNDLEKFYYEKDGDLLKLFDGLDLKEYKSNVSIKRNGERNWSSSRFYYASRHEHNKPSYYLDHDDIDNNLISLGSWSGKKRIMAVKKSFK